MKYYKITISINGGEYDEHIYIRTGARVTKCNDDIEVKNVIITFNDLIGFEEITKTEYNKQYTY